MPRQYSSISGHLTPASPRHEDMRLDSTLNVHWRDLLVICQLLWEVWKKLGQEHMKLLKRDYKGGPSTDVKTSFEVTPETLFKVVPEGNVRESPRRI